MCRASEAAVPYVVSSISLDLKILLNNTLHKGLSLCDRYRSAVLAVVRNLGKYMPLIVGAAVVCVNNADRVVKL